MNDDQAAHGDAIQDSSRHSSTSSGAASPRVVPTSQAVPKRDGGETSASNGADRGDGAPHGERIAAQTKAARNANTPWAPLAFPMYRSFWVAGLFSNLGTWMHETGALWLMTSLEPRPEMVAAVRTCMTIPVFLLALPAGVWADQFNRRLWLLGSQTLMLVIATLMAVLSFHGLITPTLLLVLTSCMGVAMILNQPAWQALTPELVPAALVPSAVAVGSISFNLARAIGPAMAGLMIAQFEIWTAFAFNAISFLGIITVLLVWKPPVEDRSQRASPEFTNELKKGMFVIKNSSNLKHTLLRVTVFAISASILWSLLSLVATDKLEFRERGFGACLGLIGIGAVVGAWILPYARSRFSSEGILLAVQCVFGGICVVIGLTSARWLIMPGLFFIGGCWMSTMTTLNATAQVNLPRKFRARGMAAFLMSFASGMAIGSLLWGWLAFAFGLSAAFVLAGIALACTAWLVHGKKIGALQAPS